MEYTQKSIAIPNKGWPFRLRLDDINGIIRLSANSSSETIRISDRSIPIDEKTKWDFHKARTGYSEYPSTQYNFIGSYIDRKYDPYQYNLWKNYVIREYRLFRDFYKSKKENK